MSIELDPSYFKVGSSEVSQSHQIDLNVIADYDASGAVVGLEFLDAESATRRVEFLALANQKSPGARSVPKPNVSPFGVRTAA